MRGYKFRSIFVIRPLPCWVRSHGRSTILIKKNNFLVLGKIAWGLPGIFPWCVLFPASLSFSSFILLQFILRSTILPPRQDDRGSHPCLSCYIWSWLITLQKVKRVSNSILLSNYFYFTKKKNK